MKANENSTPQLNETNEYDHGLPLQGKPNSIMFDSEIEFYGAEELIVWKS